MPRCTRMRISKEVLVNGHAASYSHCGLFLALPLVNELTIVRLSDGVDVFNVRCSDTIKGVDWAFDSDHVLCTLGNGSVEAFSISSPEWTCTIRAGAVGLTSAVWSPKGTHIVTVAEFAVRLSVWSLTGRSVAFIESPVMKAKDKLSFSPDGGNLAVVTGRIGQFNISIFSTSWTEMSCVTCNNEDITLPSVPVWSPDACHISIWERLHLASSTVQVYDVKLRKRVAHFTVGPKNWEPRGISTVAWTPNGQFLLVGCRNDSIYVLNYINWSMTGVFKHKKVIEENCDVLREANGRFVNVKERAVKFISVAGKLPGITKLALSSDGALVASLCQPLPAVVWIWNVERFSLLAVVILRNRVVDFKWGRGHKLCICDAFKVTMWHAGDTHQIHFDRGFKIIKCVWRPGARDQLLVFSPRSVVIVSGV